MAFSDVTRLRILELLQQGEKSASELQEHIESGQSTLSHHMKILVESGIVASRRFGKWTFYSISKSGRRYAVGLLKLLTNLPETTTTISKRRKIMKPFTIVIDTDCDISQDYIKEHGIEIMPIPFALDGKEHPRGDWAEITYQDFYNALRNGGTAKTSQINPDSFVKAFTEYAQKGEDVLLLILSSGLSATFQSSQIALAEIKESYPDCNIFPIDSISATSLNGIMATLAVQKRAEGLSAKETADFLNEKKNNVFGFFTVDDLMYLHRGGRLSKLSAVGGSLLGIKPVLNLQPNGTLALKDKVRGREAAFKLMVSQVKRSITPDANDGSGSASIDKAIIAHTDCEKEATKFAEMLKAEVDVKQVDVVVMGPVVGAHLGPGAVTVSFVTDNMTRSEYESKFYG
jgi:DegV family protein with EDD domain